MGGGGGLARIKKSGVFDRERTTLFVLNEAWRHAAFCWALAGVSAGEREISREEVEVGGWGG